MYKYELLCVIVSVLLLDVKHVLKIIFLMPDHPCASDVILNNIVVNIVDDNVLIILKKC